MQRFCFIDGMRGVAVIMVMIHHFYVVLKKSAEATLPGFLDSLCENAWVDVYCFFMGTLVYWIFLKQIHEKLFAVSSF